MDKRIAEEIISSAINIASGDRVESIKQSAPDKMMTSEQVQQLHLKKEEILDALMQDPRVTSAECKEGKFHVVTEAGSITFNFVFEDEEQSGEFMIEEENACQDPNSNHAMIDIELARTFLEIINAGVTVEDLIEHFLEDPCITTGDYKNGRFYFETTEGPLDFWFPFLKSRSDAVEKEGRSTDEV